jgi:hypothetical protein
LFHITACFEPRKPAACHEVFGSVAVCRESSGARATVWQNGRFNERNHPKPRCVRCAETRRTVRAEYPSRKTTFDLTPWDEYGELDSGSFRDSRTMWFLGVVIGLFSFNLGPFSRNVVPSVRIFSRNVVPKNGCYRVLRFMLSGRYR